MKRLRLPTARQDLQAKNNFFKRAARSLPRGALRAFYGVNLKKAYVFAEIWGIFNNNLNIACTN